MSLITFIGFLNFLLKNLYKRHKFIKWGVITAVALILISIISSHVNYNQPVISGILGVTPFFYVFGPFAFWERIRFGFISRPGVWRAIRFIIWMNAAYLLLFSVFGLSYIFTSPFSGSMLTVDAGKIAKNFVIFGMLYYAITAINKKKARYYIYSLGLFITTQIHDIQRGTIVLFIGLLLLIFFTYRKTTSVKKVLILSPLFIAGVFFLVQNTDFTNIIDKKFDAVFKLLNTDSQNQIQDASVSVRIVETTYAMDKFAENPVFGNGNLRASYKDRILPNLYFYPTDIGIYGVLYLYGLVGLFIYIAVLVLMKRQYKIIDRRNTIQMAFFFFLLYNVIATLKDANIFRNPDFFILLMLLVIYTKKNKEQSIKNTQIAHGT